MGPSWCHIGTYRCNENSTNSQAPGIDGVFESTPAKPHQRHLLKSCFTLTTRRIPFEMAALPSQDVTMGSPPPAPASTDTEALYGGYSRFEIELEVRQAPPPPPSS